MTLNQVQHQLTTIINNLYCRDTVDESITDGLEDVEEFLIQQYEKEEKLNKSIFSIVPVVGVEDLEKAINIQFNIDLDLRALLFDEYHFNECYKKFNYRVCETYTGESWQDEEHIRYINLVKTYLQDTLPDYNEIIIDVSW